LLGGFFLLRLFGAKIGKGVKIRPSVKIWAPWNLEIDDEVGIGGGTDLYCQGKIFLGYRSIISQRFFLCTGSHDYTNPIHPLYTQTITVNPQVSIAAETFIGPGVTLA
jgi:putative colanic acid biosynthesis acetyltransferase WcaF